MKRSARLFAHARREALVACAYGSVVIAAGVWAVVVWRFYSVQGGALRLLAATALCLPAMWHGAEWRRLRRLAIEERTRWELPAVAVPSRRPMDPETKAMALAVAVGAGVPAMAAIIHFITK